MTELTKLVIDYFKDHDYEVKDMVTELDNLKIEVIQEFIEKGDEVYVLKKTGAIEPYIQDKILTSIRNAAESNNQQLNTSDLNVILSDVSKSMKEMDRKIFRTDEIKEYVKKALTSEGYSQIYDSYSSYIKM